jgi:phosphoribosylaminoimidazole-succinocarboxamide synthase
VIYDVDEISLFDSIMADSTRFWAAASRQHYLLVLAAPGHLVNLGKPFSVNLDKSFRAI